MNTSFLKVSEKEATRFGFIQQVIDKDDSNNNREEFIIQARDIIMILILHINAQD